MNRWQNLFQLSTLRGLAVVAGAMGLTVDDQLIQTASVVGLGIYTLWEAFRDGNKTKF